MTVTLNLNPETEKEITQSTDVQGVDLQERIDKMIAEAVKRQPPPLSEEEQRKKTKAAIAMLRQWREEDKTNDPEEIAQRHAEWEELKQAMNESHSSNRVLFP